MKKEDVINAINSVDATCWGLELTDDELDKLNDEIRQGLVSQLFDTGYETTRLNRFSKLDSIEFESFCMKLVQDAVNIYMNCASLVTDRKVIDLDAVCGRAVEKNI